MGRTAVFGYGSLVDPASAELTLGREVSRAVPATLTGWKRRWSIWRDNRAHEKTFAIEPGGEVPDVILGLNIEPNRDGGPGVNGALIELLDGELERLDLREMRYDRVEVTELVEPGTGFDLVVAYTAKPRHFAADTPEGAVVMARYLRTVEAAFSALGPDQLQAFRETTGEPPVPAVDAVLIHDDIPAGNPRDW